MNVPMDLGFRVASHEGWDKRNTFPEAEQTAQPLIQDNTVTRNSFQHMTQTYWNILDGVDSETSFFFAGLVNEVDPLIDRHFLWQLTNKEKKIYKTYRWNYQTMDLLAPQGLPNGQSLSYEEYEQRMDLWGQSFTMTGFELEEPMGMQVLMGHIYQLGLNRKTTVHFLCVAVCVRVPDRLKQTFMFYDIHDPADRDEIARKSVQHFWALSMYDPSQNYSKFSSFTQIGQKAIKEKISEPPVSLFLPPNSDYLLPQGEMVPTYHLQYVQGQATPMIVTNSLKSPLIIHPEIAVFILPSLTLPDHQQVSRNSADLLKVETVIGEYYPMMDENEGNYSDKSVDVVKSIKIYDITSDTWCVVNFEEAVENCGLFKMMETQRGHSIWDWSDSFKNWTIQNNGIPDENTIFLNKDASTRKNNLVEYIGQINMDKSEEFLMRTARQLLAKFSDRNEHMDRIFDRGLQIRAQIAKIKPDLATINYLTGLNEKDYPKSFYDERGSRKIKEVESGEIGRAHV